MGMKRPADPLDRLRESVRWFVGVPELRLLHAHVATELRMAALMEIAKGEERYTNRGLFLLTDVPAELGPPEWDQRTQQIDELMGERRKQAAEHGVTIAEPQADPRQPPATGLEGFAVALRRHIDTLPRSVSGLVVVLAPSPLVNPAGWASDLRLLLAAPLLHRVRFIVVEEDPAPGRAVALEGGSAAECVDVQPGPTANRDLLSWRLAGMKSAPKGAEPMRLMGMAGPREAPPPRIRAVAADPELAAKELAAVGAPPGLADQDAMHALRIELTSTMLAQELNDTKTAVQHETQARDIALKAGLPAQAAMLDLMIGAQMLQGGGTGAALRHFERVIEAAQKANLPQIEAQAHMAKAAAQMVEKQPHEAARTYVTAAAAAEKADIKLFAIECYRMLGQILLNQGNTLEATSALGRAIAVAQTGTPDEVVASSAPQAARQLASIYRGQGLPRQAESLESQADEWEAGARARAAEIEAAEAAKAQQPNDAESATPPSGSNGNGAGGGAGNGAPPGWEGSN